LRRSSSAESSGRARTDSLRPSVSGSKKDLNIAATQAKEEYMIQTARKMSSLSVTSVHEGSSYRVETPMNRESHDFRCVRCVCLL